MLDLQKVYRPRSLEEALHLLSNEPLRPLAGGTDLLVELRGQVLREVSILALTYIPELQGIYEEGEHLFIGPMTTFTELIESPLIQKNLPVLAQAAQTIAGPQIRNVATVGGNVANAAVSGDCIPSLLLYDAKVRLMREGSQRTLPLKDFFTGPGTTVRGPEELLGGLLIPKEHLGDLSAHYIKYSVRKSMDLAVQGVGLALSLKQGRIEKLRAAFGVCAPTPLRLLSDDAYRGRRPDEELFQDMLAEVEGSLKLRDSWRASKAYRQHLVRVLLREAYTACLAQAKGE
ncbi:Xanthine dehydrogenase, FAD binding subunit [Clostridiaceae bacterium JG1575]|nr:Xanthine dehydrogenase, FAD binding subunit [Clostridiaceae bacterium JG1575]